MREKEEEKEGKEKEEEMGARERTGKSGKGKKQGGGKTFCIIQRNAERGVQGRSPWPLGAPPAPHARPFTR